MKFKFLGFLTFLLLTNYVFIYAQSSNTVIEVPVRVGDSSDYVSAGIRFYNNKDYKLAFKWFMEAAKLDNADGQLWVGYMYRFGYGVTKDYIEACKWFRKAAEQGNASAQNHLGSMYDITKDYEEACKWYRKAAEQGQASAQNNLGTMYYDGYGVTKDYKKAFKWYKKAAEQGLAAAQNSLGNMYRFGYGVTKDYIEACKWYRKAAEQGNASGQCGLGNMYKNGYGVPQDYQEAIRWYRKAAEQGSAAAQYNLGYMFYLGLSVTQDYVEALKWFKKSSNQGFEEAKKKVAELEELLDQNNDGKSCLPVLSWLTHDSISTRKSYSFQFGIRSDSKVEDVSVYVNGTLTRGIVPVADDGFNMKIDRTVTLNEGENKIKVTVKNAAGVASSENIVTYHNNSLATIDWIAFKPTTTEKKYVLKAGVKSKSKIESWIVSVNGTEERGINAVNNDGYNLIINKMLTLAEGDNTIRITIRNAGGEATTEKTVTYNVIKKEPLLTDRRIALIMGNANYRDSDKRLKNPVNDATDIANKIEKLGFTVIRCLDQTKRGMETAINEFGNKAKDYDVALFYYAGHGVSSNGANYMVPVDAELPAESYVKYNCTNANLVLDMMERAHCQMKIIILDACRNNPFARSWNRDISSNGLNIMNAPKGTFIAFSTAPGDVAQDGESGERNSPYTTALLQTLDVPNLSITDFFQEVLERVATRTNDRQTPWISNSFRGKFVFNKK